jgi:hypothetical protein
MRHGRRRRLRLARPVLAGGAGLTAGIVLLVVAFAGGFGSSDATRAASTAGPVGSPPSAPQRTPALTTPPADRGTAHPLSSIRPGPPSASAHRSPGSRPAAGCSGAADTPGGADPWGGCWPGRGNTGVPAGTRLTVYTGPCDIRSNNVVIDAKIVTCGGMLVYGSNLTIRRSQVVGFVKTNSPSASLLIEDSEVAGENDQSEALGTHAVTVLRSDVYGDQHSVHCDDRCTVVDSWLHDQHDGKAAGWHQNAFITNGGSDHLLRHNTLFCRGGCTADIALIPDDDITRVTIDRNLLVASPDSAYCLYGGGSSGNKPGSPDHIVVTNNVFQPGANGKCAAFGPVTYFESGAAGDKWSGNAWADGKPVAAEN